MKKFSKILSVALLVALVLSLGVANAFADGTITVTNVDPDRDEKEATETYVAYKIFDAVKADGVSVTTTDTTQTSNGAITYQIAAASPWFSVLFNEDGTAKSGNNWFTAVKIDGVTPETWQVIPAASYNNEAAAKAAAAWLLANKGSINGTTLTVGETNTVDDGYYLVTSSLGTNLGLATTDIPMSIVEKNDYPSIDKKQKDAENSGAAYADTAVAVQVGDTINYQVVVWVPATTSGDIVVTDTMSSGLAKPDPFTINVKVGDADENKNPPTSFTTELAASVTDGSNTTVNYTLDTNPTGKTWAATIKPTASTLGKFVEFTFNAVVTEAAIIDTGKINTADLTYSNYYQHDTVPYEIYAAGLVKFDGDTATVNTDTNVLVAAQNKEIKYLAGAEFQLLDAADSTTPIPVSYNSTEGYYYPDANGTAVITSVNNENGIVIRGLDNQTYYLKETKAPAGYTLIQNPFAINVIKDTYTAAVEANESEGVAASAASHSEITDPYVIKVANNSGTVLPSTGGIGTTIFYVVGGVLVLAAIILLVTKKRMSD